MREKSKVISPNYQHIIPQNSDEDIINILKKRKLYQKEAAEIAIQEAVKRGLIHSEQDLFAPEFETSKIEKSFFPQIENKTAHEKLVKSIARSLLIVGLIPAAWGIIKIIMGDYPEGIILTLGGVLWFYFSMLLLKQYSKRLLLSLFVLLLIAVFYTIKLFLLLPSFVFMDIFIPITLVSFIVYGLLFLHRLNS